MAIDLTVTHKHSSKHRAELAASDEDPEFYEAFGERVPLTARIKPLFRR